MAEGRELHLNLESKLSSVDAAELIAQRMLDQHGCGPDLVERIGMAVRECMANAGSHGNGYSSDKSVYFSVATDPSRLSITITDEGNGFNPDDVPDPLAGDNLLKSSGRGLLLMRSFADEVSIRSADPHGTEVVMVKSFEQDPSHKEEEVSLSTSIREVDGVTIVDLSGRITLGEASEKLRDTVREIVSNGQTKILLNLGDVGYIDSSGLGQLVSSYTTAKTKGSTVNLVNVQEKVNDLLQITKLYTVFDIFSNETDAVLSFSQ